MRRIGLGASLLIALIMSATRPVPAEARGQGQAAANPPIPHDSGQSITPSFEGWYKNADGTYSLSFGYMNRNYKETPDVPVGPNNRFSPGPEDRGQPTHFLPRRQWGVFAVVLPATFANEQNATLTWTISVHGQPVSVPGHLRPEWEIDALKEATSGNRPPEVRFDPKGAAGQGPLGVAGSIEVPFPGPATLTVYVSDDGIKKQSDRGSAAPLGVGWTKFRGPGTVTFGDRDAEDRQRQSHDHRDVQRARRVHAAPARLGRLGPLRRRLPMLLDECVHEGQGHWR